MYATSGKSLVNVFDDLLEELVRGEECGVSVSLDCNSASVCDNANCAGSFANVIGVFLKLFFSEVRTR